ncbi:unnamed protein product [Amaranthus hypochondriacus]
MLLKVQDLSWWSPISTSTLAGLRWLMVRPLYLLQYPMVLFHCRLLLNFLQRLRLLHLYWVYPPPVKITFEDIAEEVTYWNSSVVCFVLGANPPLHVIEGFVTRIWKDYGVFLVKLKSIDDVHSACAMSGILFDKKPYLVKPWKKNMSYDESALSSAPVWIRFPKLDVAYWGAPCLRKFVGMLGEVLRIDSATINYDKLMFARVLVDMKLNGVFPEEIYFTNEEGTLISQKVLYD